jgi:isocitrate lyase
MMLAHNTDGPREDLLKYYVAAGFEVAGIRMNQVQGGKKCGVRRGRLRWALVHYVESS